MIIDKDNHPPIGIMGGIVHSYERGLSPWHRDAFPDEFKNLFPEQEDRKEGWFALDAWGNAIGGFLTGWKSRRLPNETTIGSIGHGNCRLALAGPYLISDPSPTQESGHSTASREEHGVRPGAALSRSRPALSGPKEHQTVEVTRVINLIK